MNDTNKETPRIGTLWSHLFFDILSMFCALATSLTMIQRINEQPVRRTEEIGTYQEQLKYKFETLRDVVKRFFFLLGEADPTFTNKLPTIGSMSFMINKYKYATYVHLKSELYTIKSEIDSMHQEIEKFTIDNELKDGGEIQAEAVLHDINTLLAEWGTTAFSEVIVGLKRINKSIFKMLHC